MAVAFDAATVDTGGGGWAGSPRNIAHTPAGTPRGILCLITAADAADVVSGVTYGGVSMARVGAGTVISSQSTEDGSVYAYFLGASIPTGAQTCAITNTASAAGAVVISMTAGNDTEVDAAATDDDNSFANPAVTLNTTAATDTFIAGALWSGHNAIGSVAPAAGYTEIAEDDFGSQVVSFIRRTTNGSGGSISAGWTATAEDAVLAAVAIREATTTTYSATVAFALGGIELAAAAESDPPIFAAAAAFALGGLELAASAEGPLFESTCAFALGGIELAAVGDWIPSVGAATVAFALGGIELAAAIDTGQIDHAATCAFPLGPIALAAAATFTPPTMAATAAFELGGLEIRVAMDTYWAFQCDFMLGGIDLAAVIDYTAPAYTAAAAFALGGLRFSGAAFGTPPVPGPYCIDVAQVWAPGIVDSENVAAAEVFSPGTMAAHQVCHPTE